MEHLSAIATNLLGCPAYLTAPTNVEGPVTRACEWGHIVYLCRNSVARTVVGLYYADGSVVEHQLDHLYVELEGYASETKRPDHYPGPPPSSTTRPV